MGQSSIIVEIKDNISDSVLEQIKTQKQLGFRDIRGSTLLFNSGDGMAEISDIISYLAAQGLKIEKVGKQEASLEDLYAAILKEVEKK